MTRPAHCSEAGYQACGSSADPCSEWVFDSCRDIFERVIHLSLAAKRMKFFFKRYLDYEKKYGTSETIQAVKVAALEYVESKSSLAES